MPGTDPAETIAVVLGELPDFPHLPELPDRGPGADPTGRRGATCTARPGCSKRTLTRWSRRRPAPAPR